jgi:hypothetical protein
MGYRDAVENDFSFEEITGYGHSGMNDAPPDPSELAIDEETGCTGAEMHQLDCTVDVILWYESREYRESVLVRLGRTAPKLAGSGDFPEAA